MREAPSGRDCATVSSFPMPARATRRVPASHRQTDPEDRSKAPSLRLTPSTAAQVAERSVAFIERKFGFRLPYTPESLILVDAIIDKVKAADVHVITNAPINLHLEGRHDSPPVRRGIA